MTEPSRLRACARRPRAFLTALALSITALGCATANLTKLSEPARDLIASHHVERTVELRQSCYYGELYDENDKWLLSPYPFAHTSHIVDLHDQPLHPRRQMGIVPAGTAFVIKRVEFPDRWAVSQRMLTTPRYNAWIYLEPAVPAPPEAPNKPLIWVLPSDLDTPEAAEAAIEAAFAKPSEVSRWLATLRPTMRVGVEHKDPLVGMALPELTAAMGDPVRWYVDDFGQKKARVAWYFTHEAWLIDDVVADVRPPRAPELATVPEAAPVAAPALVAPPPADSPR